MDTPLADKVEAFASTPYAFENGLVYSLALKGALTRLKDAAALKQAKQQNRTIRVLGMMDFNLKIRLIGEHLRGVYDHHGPITCMAVIAGKNAPTQDWHTDSVGIWMKVIRGQKLIQYENGVSATDFAMGFDKDVYIAPDTKFRVVNREPSMTLVYRFEQFMEDKAF